MNHDSNTNSVSHANRFSHVSAFIDDLLSATKEHRLKWKLSMEQPAVSAVILDDNQVHVIQVVDDYRRNEHNVVLTINGSFDGTWVFGDFDDDAGMRSKMMELRDSARSQYNLESSIYDSPKMAASMKLALSQ